MNTQFIIPAGGMGLRLNAGIPKALIPLGNRPLLAQTLSRLSPMQSPLPMIVVVPPGREDEFHEMLRREVPQVDLRLIPGGAERQDSVWYGLQELSPEADMVAIHDAARPLVSEAALKHAIEAAASHGAATLATPVSDTILCAYPSAILEHTPDRSRLWACQTPQVFRRDIVLTAYEYARARHLQFTDDATLVHHAGFPVKLVDGGPFNIKVTTPIDLELSELLFRKGIV